MKKERSDELKLPFEIGDRVYIDGDKGLIVVIVAILIKVGSLQFEVSWVHNGAIHTSWVDIWRLTNVVDD